MNITELIDYLPVKYKKSYIYYMINKEGLPHEGGGAFPLRFDKEQVDTWWRGKMERAIYTPSKLRPTIVKVNI